ncbi:hypothetical protein ACHAW5_002620 [Stephanodiscus triporus]|uniref:Uncharacterized protein n=1 Tax=Stephanodiscus triporus TaxID=2934178 RepID=A0ABD3PVC3_9STRA
MPPKGRDNTRSHKSEQGLAKIKKYFQGLPRSTPFTIISDEKWFPYSHYEFHRDGSPYAELVERPRTPSVPEMLSIELPTGFDASHLSGSTLSVPPPPLASSNRAAPTIVDFPSTPKSSREGKENNSDELDQLSPAGKKFLEQLPDLSYMLKSTLSLPHDGQ